MLYASTTTRTVTSTLDEMGFEELLALPAVPVNNPRRMRCPVTVRTSVDGSRWYLRSYGTGFDLVDPTRRSCLGRWYSVGWGLYEGREVAELLLVQAVETGQELAGVLDRISTELADLPASGSLGHGRHGRELRLCAVLDRMPVGRC